MRKKQTAPDQATRLWKMDVNAAERDNPQPLWPPGSNVPWVALICALLGGAFCPAQPAAGAAPGLAIVAEPQFVFSGTARKIPLTVHNAGDQDFEGELRVRVLQTTSATAVGLGEAPWKTLHVLARQTVLESAPLDFPAVNGETRFLVQWLEPSLRVAGTAEVWVYPTNLLAELKSLVGDQRLGVFDPLDQLKPLLRDLRQDFTDLESADVEKFSGKLAIFGPFNSIAQWPGNLAEQIQALAKRNVAVVWFQPPPKHGDNPQPSFYIVPEKQGAIVVAQSALVANLPVNPQAQLHLIFFCKRALVPEPLPLPTSPINQ